MPQLCEAAIRERLHELESAKKSGVTPLKRTAGYPSTKYSSSSSLITFVRIWSSRCAPRGVHLDLLLLDHALADHLVHRGFNEGSADHLVDPVGLKNLRDRALAPTGPRLADAKPILGRAAAHFLGYAHRIDCRESGKLRLESHPLLRIPGR